MDIHVIPKQPEKLLRPKEVAEYLTMSPLTLLDWRCHGGGPAYIKVGRHVFYRMSDVLSWLDSRTYAARDRDPRDMYKDM